jgi:hypothetical protein
MLFDELLTEATQTFPLSYDICGGRNLEDLSRLVLVTLLLSRKLSPSITRYWLRDSLFEWIERI